MDGGREKEGRKECEGERGEDGGRKGRQRGAGGRAGGGYGGKRTEGGGEGGKGGGRKGAWVGGRVGETQAGKYRRTGAQLAYTRIFVHDRTHACAHALTQVCRQDQAKDKTGASSNIHARAHAHTHAARKNTARWLTAFHLTHKCMIACTRAPTRACKQDKMLAQRQDRSLCVQSR